MSTKCPPLMTCLTDILFFIFFCLAAFVQQNDPDPFFWETVYIVPALLCLASLCKPQLKESMIWSKCISIHVVCYGSLALYLLWTLITTYQYSKTTTAEDKAITLQSIFHTLEIEEGREFLGVCIVLAWLMYGKSSTGYHILKMNGKFFWTPVFIATIPLAMWGCCYINGISEHIRYCRHISKDCASATGRLPT